MSVLPLLLGALSGICIATGIIFLFTGLRRQGRDQVHVLFSLFAFSYGGANLTSVLEYKASSLEEFLRMGDWTAIFTVATLVFLLWFVSEYTKVKPRIFLWGLTLVFAAVTLVAVGSPTSVHGEIMGIVTATLPWGETISLLDASEGPWELVFFFSQLSVIGFLIFASIKQWLRGERRKASTLGFGLLFLIFALIFDMVFIDSGAINFVYIGDYAFIPLLVIMSLQLSNQVIRTDEELASYRQNLEQLVGERTQELEETANILQQTERRARALLDAPPDTAMLITVDGEILATNQIGASRLGLSTENAVGKNVFDYFDPELAAIRKSKENELAQKKQPLQWEDQREGRFYRNQMYPVIDDQGEVESVAVFAADITERKQAENVLHRHNEELRYLNRIASEIATHTEVTSALHSASALITDLFQGLSTHIIYMGARDQDLEILTGFDQQDGPQAPRPINLQLGQLPRCKEVMETGKSTILTDLESLPIQKDIKNFMSEKMIRHLMIAPLFIKGESIGIIAVSAGDERQNFEQHELNVLEAIAGYIAAAIENARLAYDNIEAAAVEERNRLARDLHDAVTQTIYAASLIIESLPQVWERNPEEGQRNLFKLRQLIHGALAEMRSLLFELRPDSLERASIDSLIQFVADAFTGRTKVPVSLEINGFGDQPSEVKTIFYRITQEIFNNITKHAEATSVIVSLDVNSKQLALRVKDNGLGFDFQANHQTGMGLSIMQERAEQVGAQLKIESQPGEGTRVSLYWSEQDLEQL